MSDCRYEGAFTTLPILPMLVPYGVRSTCAFVRRDAGTFPLLWDGCNLADVLDVPLAPPRMPVMCRGLFGPVVSGLRELPVLVDPYAVLVCCWAQSDRPEPDEAVAEYEHLAGAAIRVGATPRYMFNGRDDNYPESMRRVDECRRLGNDPLVLRMRNRGTGICVAVGANDDVLLLKLPGVIDHDYLVRSMQYACITCHETLVRHQYNDFLSKVAQDLPPDGFSRAIWRIDARRRQGLRQSMARREKVDPLERLLSDFVPTTPDYVPLWASDSFEGLEEGSRSWCVARLIEGCEASGVPYRGLLREMQSMM